MNDEMIEEIKRKPLSSEFCQAAGCNDLGSIYDDKLIPIRLCAKHAKLRHNNGRRGGRR